MSKSTQWINQSIGASFAGHSLMAVAAFSFDWRMGLLCLSAFFHIHAFTCVKAAGLAKTDELVEGGRK